jgi:hypothetical protein
MAKRSGKCRSGCSGLSDQKLTQALVVRDVEPAAGEVHAMVAILRAALPDAIPRPFRCGHEPPLFPEPGQGPAVQRIEPRPGRGVPTVARYCSCLVEQDGSPCVVLTLNGKQALAPECPTAQVVGAAFASGGLRDGKPRVGRVVLGHVEVEPGSQAGEVSSERTQPSAVRHRLRLLHPAHDMVQLPPQFGQQDRWWQFGVASVETGTRLFGESQAGLGGSPGLEHLMQVPKISAERTGAQRRARIDGPQDGSGDLPQEEREPRLHLVTASRQRCVQRLLVHRSRMDPVGSGLPLRHHPIAHAQVGGEFTEAHPSRLAQGTNFSA